MGERVDGQPHLRICRSSHGRSVPGRVTEAERPRLSHGYGNPTAKVPLVPADRPRKTLPLDIKDQHAWS